MILLMINPNLFQRMPTNWRRNFGCNLVDVTRMSLDSQNLPKSTITFLTSSTLIYPNLFQRIPTNRRRNFDCQPCRHHQDEFGQPNFTLIYSSLLLFTLIYHNLLQYSFSFQRMPTNRRRNIGCQPCRRHQDEFG